MADEAASKPGGRELQTLRRRLRLLRRGRPQGGRPPPLPCARPRSPTTRASPSPSRSTRPPRALGTSAGTRSSAWRASSLATTASCPAPLASLRRRARDGARGVAGLLEVLELGVHLVRAAHLLQHAARLLQVPAQHEAVGRLRREERADEDGRGGAHGELGVLREERVRVGNGQNRSRSPRSFYLP